MLRVVPRKIWNVLQFNVVNSSKALTPENPRSGRKNSNTDRIKRFAALGSSSSRTMRDSKLVERARHGRLQ
jgi:hypothetical protein